MCNCSTESPALQLKDMGVDIHINGEVEDMEQELNVLVKIVENLRWMEGRNDERN